MTNEVDIARALERIHSLELWQEKQNGQLGLLVERFEDFAKRIDTRFESVGEKIMSTKNWLIATLTSSLVVLIVFSANLIITKR